MLELVLDPFELPLFFYPIGLHLFNELLLLLLE